MKIKNVLMIVGIVSVVMGFGLISASSLFWCVFICMAAVGISNKNTWSAEDVDRVQKDLKRQRDFSRKVVLNHQKLLRDRAHRYRLMTAGYNNMTLRKRYLGG